MSLDPRTPVLVGAGAFTQHADDEIVGFDALDCMTRAVLGAAEQTGRALLERVELIAVPNGTWPHRDPGRLLAQRVGCGRVRSLVAEVGILQQALLDLVCTRIADGALGVALVVGGEARRVERRLAQSGLPAPTVAEVAEAPPDEFVAPAVEILTGVEIEREMATPAGQYAIIDRALAHHDGLDHDHHVARLGALWETFGHVAAGRPEAWDRSAPDASSITTATATNRLLAAPYTRLLCSQWTVDQAAALVICSVEEAERAGVPRDQWVFPWAGACSNLTVPLAARAELHRSAAVRSCADAVREHAGVDVAEVALRDLYSCFPSAVQVQCRELGIAVDGPDPLTVTGGMTFGGGPLNNYVLQAMVALVADLRDDPSQVALSTSISGMLTKPGLGLWSATPPAVPYRALDVTVDARARTDTRTLDPDLTGDLSIVGSTVICDRGEPASAVVVAEDRTGTRTIAVSHDTTLAAAMVNEHLAGEAVHVADPGLFTR